MLRDTRSIDDSVHEGVRSTEPPTDLGLVITAVLNANCGNIEIAEETPIMMTATLRFVLPCVVLLLLVCAARSNQTIAQQERPAAPRTDARESDQGDNEENAVNIHYLEIVTPNLDKTCGALEKTHGVTFGEPIAEFGNARMTKLKNGGRLGVRAPMRETEKSVVRPYILVDDIETAVEAAKAAGGEFAMLPMEIPGQGKFAIYFLGDIQYGLWQR